MGRRYFGGRVRGGILAAYTVAFAASVVILVAWPDGRAPTRVSLTAVDAAITAGDVRAATMDDDARTIEIERRDGTRVRASYPTTLGAVLADRLLDQGVEVTVRPAASTPLLLRVLVALLPLALIGAVVLLYTRRLRTGGSFARATRASEVPTTRFSDIGGVDEVVAELAEVRDFLVDPQRFAASGARAPRGFLLTGPPGTGKTMLARAVAGEAGVPFFSMNASEFVEMIVGVGASRARDLFKKAREAAPAIVFIDELDAIGRARGAGSISGANAEQEQALNQILTEMDGFSASEGVIVIGATNRPDVLDPALLRPGRFDRRVTVQPPDKTGRLAVLQVHTRGVPLEDDVDLTALAAKTPGLVGAELRNLVNEAALAAARRDAKAVARHDFEDALEKLVLGPKRPLVLAAKDRERIAYHEAGHAIVGLVLPDADPVTRVTITPRGHSLGVTYQAPEDDRYNFSEAYVRARIVGALGGRAAEELVYGDRTTGAENDLEHVTRLARMMVTRWGMSEGVGPLSLVTRDDPYLSGAAANPAAMAMSEETARLVDAEVRRIVDESYRTAKELLHEHRAALDALATALLDKESLDAEDVQAVVGPARGRPTTLAA